MRFSVRECPKCKGELEIKDDQEVAFCKYCGTEFSIQHTKAEHNTYVKVKQMEHEQKLKEMEYAHKREKIKAKEEKEKRESKELFIIILCWFGIPLLLYLLIPFIRGIIRGIEEKSEPKTNALTIQNFTFELPIYLNEEGSEKNLKKYYALNDEEENRMVTLTISFPEETTKDYDVSYEWLEQANEFMIMNLEKSYDDCGVYNNETYENKNGVKGILYSFNYVQIIDWFTKEDATGYCFVFPSEDDRRWFYVTFLCTNNVDDSTYKDDFMDMLATIDEKTASAN